jgi:hypothetical protein
MMLTVTPASGWPVAALVTVPLMPSALDKAKFAGDWTPAVTLMAVPDEISDVGQDVPRHGMLSKSSLRNRWAPVELVVAA